MATVIQIVPVRDLFLWGSSLRVTKGPAPWFSAVRQYTKRNYWCGFVQLNQATGTCWGIRFDCGGPSSLYGTIGEAHIALYQERVGLTDIDSLRVARGKGFLLDPYRLYLPGRETSGQRSLHGQDDFLASNVACLQTGNLIQRRELITALRPLPLNDELLIRYFELLDGWRGQEFLAARIGLAARVCETVAPPLDGTEQSATQWHRVVETTCATTIMVLRQSA